MAVKQDSSDSGLRIAEETAFATVGGSEVWYPYEPNSYTDFGAQITTIPRTTINDTRQRLKGTIAGVDGAAGFQTDFTQDNLYRLIQGFMWASWRAQPSEAVTVVDIDGANPDEYEVASTTGFIVNRLILARNFTNAANNGLKLVTAVVLNTSVEVATGSLVAEASPPATAEIKVVGHQATAGDLDVVAASGGALGYISSTTLDFTLLGLYPGCWIYVGGDTAGTKFANAANNGYKRVYSIAAGKLEIDKTASALVTESSTTETVRIFVGDTLKNEAAKADRVTRTYQAERTLGDDGGGIQSEYEVGSVPATLQFNVPVENKITVDIAFVSKDEELRTGATGVKAGTRPAVTAITALGAFNTSTDVKRSKVTLADGTDLGGFVTEMTLSLNNNITMNKAVGVVGAFEASAGFFQVGGSFTSYFTTTAAKTQIRANADVSVDLIVAKSNAGWAFDMPLVQLGDGRLRVELNQPITMPLTVDATAHGVFNHTLLLNCFDYLPNAATA